MIQDIPDRLLLREDQPPFWCRGIERDHEDHKIHRGEQIADDRKLRCFLWLECADEIFQSRDLKSGDSADRNHMLFLERFHAIRCFLRNLGGAEITFIEDDDRRNCFLLDLFQKGEIFRGHTDGAIHNEDGNVSFV